MNFKGGDQSAMVRAAAGSARDVLHACDFVVPCSIDSVSAG